MWSMSPTPPTPNRPARIGSPLVPMSRFSAAPRRIGLSPTGTIPVSAGCDQHCREERCVLQQHADMRRPVGVQPCAQRRRHCGAVLDVVAPAGERLLEVHTAVVDVDQRCDQRGYGGQLAPGCPRFKPVCQPVRDRCAAAARWHRRPRTPSPWPPGNTGAPGDRCRCRHRRARAPWCGRPGAPPRLPKTPPWHVDLGGKVLGQPPRRLCQRQPQRLDVDVAVGQPLTNRLEAADRAVELLTLAGVFGGQLQRALQDAELKSAAAQGGMRGQPGPRPRSSPTSRSDPSSTPCSSRCADAAVAGGAQRR